MDDKEIMGVLLRRLYEDRYNPLSSFSKALSETGVAANVARSLIDRLQERGLIEVRTRPVGNLGYGKLTDWGIDVVEGNVPPPIPINFSQVTIHGSSNVQVGQGNTQGVSLDIEKVVAAIDHSTATENEKVAAKSLLEKITENPLLRMILGNFIKPGPG